MPNSFESIRIQLSNSSVEVPNSPLRLLCWNLCLVSAMIAFFFEISSVTAATTGQSPSVFSSIITICWREFSISVRSPAVEITLAACRRSHFEQVQTRTALDLRRDSSINRQQQQEQQQQSCSCCYCCCCTAPHF
eukprot:TRINITY_DN6408_c0_g1_i1.p1 TRINITY_DN6408_c0_g1~~TRINITY_DN6408_c0_g1_i1.p1  ORF type:complete len:135 (-),score=19.87 TRINITY_DN6408_c0_g1_i1:116-520(-)